MTSNELKKVKVGSLVSRSRLTRNFTWGKTQIAIVTDIQESTINTKNYKLHFLNEKFDLTEALYFLFVNYELLNK